MTTSDTALIAIDWGTTNRRGYLLDDSGNIQESLEDNLGILAVPAAGFEDALETFVAKWRRADGSRPPVLMSGMVGSRQGWIEASYALCPACAGDLAASVMRVPTIEDTWIVPGICLNDDRRDVMRGEEVQIFGALELTSRTSATICLPGTHSKWARVEDARLTDFATAMTGETFEIMRTHSILSTLMNKDAAHDGDAFRRGLEKSASTGGLLNHMFSVRADGLFGVTGADQQSSYLSGVLIGNEIRQLAGTFHQTAEPVLLVGTAALARIYNAAFDYLGIACKSVDGEAATVKGLAAIWSEIARA